jgi:hypothetical protein
MWSNGNSFETDERRARTLPYVFRAGMGVPVTLVSGA